MDEDGLVLDYAGLFSAFPLKEPVIAGSRGAKAGRQRSNLPAGRRNDKFSKFYNASLQQEEI